LGLKTIQFSFDSEKPQDVAFFSLSNCFGNWFTSAKRMSRI